MMLAGRAAIVTGAGRGLGKAIALALASQGVAVALLARTVTELDAVARQVRDSGGNAAVVPIDLEQPDAIVRAVDATLGAFDRLDIVINNAGWSPPLRPVLETPLETWDRAMNVNARAAFLLSKACLPALRDAGGGQIINICTAAVEVPIATISAYRASKAAQRAFAECLREEVRPLGIKVINVLPEPMGTSMRWQATPDFPRDRVMAPEVVAKVVLELLQHDPAVFVDEVAVRML